MDGPVTDINEPLSLDATLLLGRFALEAATKTILKAIETDVPCEATSFAAMQFSSSGIGYTLENLFGSLLLSEKELPRRVQDNLKILYVCDRFNTRCHFINSEGEVNSWETERFQEALNKDKEDILKFWGLI